MALITVPVLAGLIYAIVLAHQVASLAGGPDRNTIIVTAIGISLMVLAFVVIVLLPVSVFARKSPHFRLIVTLVGVGAWFAASVLAFILLGQVATVAVSTAAQLLAIGIPTVVAFALLLGKGLSGRGHR